MSRKIWITRDAQGNVLSSTEVRSTAGCSGCLWVLLGLFVVVAPAAWTRNGDIPVAAAVVMYIVEAAVVFAAVIQYVHRRGMGSPRPAAPPCAVSPAVPEGARQGTGPLSPPDEYDGPRG